MTQNIYLSYENDTILHYMFLVYRQRLNSTQKGTNAVINFGGNPVESFRFMYNDIDGLMCILKKQFSESIQINKGSYLSASSVVDAENRAGFAQLYKTEHPTRRCVARSLVSVTPENIGQFPQMVLPNG